MSEQTQAWLTGLSIIAPIVASLGVLWLSNKQQSRNLLAQHDLDLEKEKISVLVVKVEELFSDIQRRKKHLEINGFQLIKNFILCKSKNEFLKKNTEDFQAINFDLVRMDLNFKAYFPELEHEYRKAEKLVHATGEIQANMLQKFYDANDKKKDLNGQYLKAQILAISSLDELSQALASRIGDLMNLRRSLERK